MKFKSPNGDTLELTEEAIRDKSIDSSIINLPTEEDMQKGYYLEEEYIPKAPYILKYSKAERFDG